MLNGLILATVAVFALSWPGAGSADATSSSTTPFTVVALGDAPYSDPLDYLRFSGLIHTINELKPVFSVHVGDIKAGSRPCTDRRLTRIRDYFDDFDSALIYTPGDNEWTDCHRVTAGGWDPLDRLELLRRHYFSTSKSHGKKPIRLTRQSDDKRFEKFVENARWTRGGVGFVTAHVVGSYNNAERRDVAARAEFKERDKASSTWIADGFAWAQKANMKGLVIFIHADPLRGRDHDRKVGKPFGRTVKALKQGAVTFKKPVLVVHGDYHEYKLDKPFTTSAGKAIENLTRLEVQGAPEVWATRIDIDPASPSLFKIAPLKPVGAEAPAPD